MSDKNKEIGCLILNGKLNDIIMIGKDIKITVISIHRNIITLRIEAPKNVNINRGI